MLVSFIRLYLLYRGPRGALRVIIIRGWRKKEVEFHRLNWFYNTKKLSLWNDDSVIPTDSVWGSKLRFKGPNQTH